MYTILLVLGGSWIVQGANYQRYDESTRFPVDTTSQNKYSQNMNYGDDMSILTEGKPYSSYGVDSSTPRYDSAGPGSGYYPALGGSRYAPGYGQGYGNGYGQNYDQGYGQGYGQNFGQSYSSYELPFVRNGRDYCVNRVPQTGIWVDRLMGMWYGVEVVQHLAGDSTPNYERTCIVVHISEPKDRIPTNKQLHHVEALNARFRQMYRQLRLVWDEQGDTVEYSLYFTNDSAGYWQAFDHQNGSMAQRSTYQQFTGTVQVLKAVNDHLVLNFCQEAANGKPAELYSVLFSRDARTMSQWEVESVHSLLQNKNLSVASRRLVCGNGAGRPYYSLLFTFLTGLFACILCSS